VQSYGALENTLDILLGPMDEANVGDRELELRLTNGPYVFEFYTVPWWRKLSQLPKPCVIFKQ
jgi:hypothetical protein